MGKIIVDAIVIIFALFGLLCAVFFVAFYHILKEDASNPTDEDIYAAENQRREYAAKS